MQYYDRSITDINPLFTAPVYDCWPIVMSSIAGPAASYCDVIMADCSHGFLCTDDVEVSEVVIICGTVNCLAGDVIILRYRIIHCSLRHTGSPHNSHTFRFNSLFFTLFLIFGPRVSTWGICGAMNCSVSDVIINCPTATHTVQIMAWIILQRRV